MKPSARMKSSALWREIWRDIHTGTAWTVIFTVLASALLTGLAATDLMMVSRLNQQAQHFRNVMANVHVVEAPQKIDPHACMALSHLAGVHSAVAVRNPEHQVSANALPSSNIRTYEATSGVEHIVRVPTFERATAAQSPGQMGVYLSQDVAQTLGASAGSTVRLDNEDITVLGVFPWSEDDGRRPGFAYSLFIPTAPTGLFDECWVDTWPMNPDLEPFMRGAVLPSDEPGQPVKLYSFNSSLGSSFNGQGLFYGRMTASTPFIIAVIAVLLGATSVWRRRLEFSSDLHAGVAQRDLITKFMWETAAWVGATVILSTPVMTWVILRNPTHDHHAMTLLATVHLVAGACGCLFGALAASLTIREKHLLRYFKNR